MTLPDTSLLIADSGSTKTDWAVCRLTGCDFMTTPGLNPFMQQPGEMADTLRHELLPALHGTTVKAVRFYGAGCRGQGARDMAALLGGLFPGADVEVESDLLGAARALCGRREGIACILGTGSNSGLYDGQAIVCQTPSLGYVLGDEGSGATLGRRLVSDALKGALGDDLADAFRRETGLAVDTAIERVYRAPYPNRFLASFAPFLHAHREHPEIHLILLEEFRRFFRRNIAPYARRELPVGFVGSIALHFADEVREAAAAEAFTVGAIQKSPLPLLVEYHQDDKGN